MEERLEENASGAEKKKSPQLVAAGFSVWRGWQESNPRPLGS
jgi:hypothetical protein